MRLFRGEQELHTPQRLIEAHAAAVSSAVYEGNELEAGAMSAAAKVA